ncbi:hypothetical protein OIO90_006413 [Microbotryomycetes sp. JL221]|nr:hypothetical protein OIO90_006413 [Microbotryomycetes sp. JL221]
MSNTTTPSVTRPGQRATMMTLPSLLSDLQQLGRDRSLLPNIDNVGSDVDHSTSLSTTTTPTGNLKSSLLSNDLDYSSSHAALYQHAMTTREEEDPGRQASLMAVKVANEFLDNSNDIVDKVEQGVVEQLRDRIETVQERVEQVLSGLGQQDQEPTQDQDMR